jgi:hypothetical protein
MPTATDTDQATCTDTLDLHEPIAPTSHCDICRLAPQLTHGLCLSCFDWVSEQIMPIRG